MEASQNVCEDGGVGMPDMRGVIHIVNRSSNVKIFHVPKDRKLNLFLTTVQFENIYKLHVRKRKSSYFKYFANFSLRNSMRS